MNIEIKNWKNLLDGQKVRTCRSEGYNYNYYYNEGFHINPNGKPEYHNAGFFQRWGNSYKDDPNMAPFPEILDIEVTTICKGIPNKNGVKTPCQFCYKSNGPKGLNMSFDTFQSIIDKFPKINGIHTLTQVAFGADSEATSNPELFKMMEYCRTLDIVPNITVANITDETADKITKYCGAVAVSRYANKDVCYDSVKKLTDRGMKQVNIHIMVSDETYSQVMETLKDRISDPRLSKLNAIVLLSLKQCGRGQNFNILPQNKFIDIVNYSLDNKIGIGFDSCSCHRFLDAIKNHKDYEKFLNVCEPCESVIFSSYCSAEGKFFSCSFCENDNFGEGIDMTKVNDFIKDVWYNEKVVKFRDKLLKNNRACPAYKIFEPI